MVKAQKNCYFFRIRKLLIIKLLHMCPCSNTRKKLFFLVFKFAKLNFTAYIIYKFLSFN